jgi:hypothetical protein
MPPHTIIRDLQNCKLPMPSGTVVKLLQVGDEFMLGYGTINPATDEADVPDDVWLYIYVDTSGVVQNSYTNKNGTFVANS